MDIKINAIQLRMDESDLRFSFCKGETEWSWTKDYRPKMECKEGTVFFDEALEIHHELVQNGIGKGIRSSFAGFEIEGTKVPYAFETYAWIEETTEDIFFEWVPICEEGITVEKVFWPGEMELEEKKNDWYTLLNMQQGVLIPNDWETELTAIPFDGFFETAGGYMPWFSQFKGGNGYIAICTTPWNAGYQAEHPENGPYTHVGVRFEPSLGRMDYKRVVRYTLIEDGDYNDACKIYRDYVREQGNLCTLNEKAARVASVDDLIGCSFIHKGIKTFVQPESDFFDPEIQKIVSEDGCSIYRMKNVTGEGVITRYEILPGIELFYNDFHMSDGQNQNKLPHSDVLEINHCREGRFECEFANGDYQYVGAGDLAINRLTNETTSTYFPLSHYHGISITIDLPTADQTMKRIESVIGGLNIDVFSIADKFCKNDTCVVLRTQSEIEHIFSELYRVEPRMIAYYLKVKVLELLMFLNQVSLQDYQEERRYFARNQVQTIKKVQEYMTADLRNHYTLQELSEKFEIPLTSMKVCFKGVYGCSIYAYMKSYRMQAATILLRDTSDSITEIAAKMGYDNPSKFSEVFKKEFGELPSEFRKKLSK